MKEFSEMTYDEMLICKKELEHAISQRMMAFTKRASYTLMVGDTVDIGSHYPCKNEQNKKGVVKKLIGNKIYVPGLDHNEYGNTPYYNAITKITRDGQVIFDRNNI